MTPEELEKLPKPLERIMTALEASILTEIVDRIKEMAEITPTIDWLLLRMDCIGASRSKIKRLISDALEDAEKQVDEVYQQAIESDFARNKEIYQAAGRDYLSYEDNQWMQQITEAVRRQTKDSLRQYENITQTTGFNVSAGGGRKEFTPLSEYLERSLDKAMLGIVTGVKSYNQAICDVIDEMTASGIRIVDYASGKSDRIEVAARRAIMTGVAQLTDQVNEKNAEELGTDYWEVDWHMGARNTGTGYMNHQSWQGKVYSSEEMRTICGLGEMLGFAGINCYHIRFPFVPGVSKRKYTDEWLEEQNRKENEKKPYKGREYDTYAALQYQRRLERTMRKQKQDTMLLERAGASEDDIIAAKCRFQSTSQVYTDFSKQMGLRQQRERLEVPKSADMQLLDKNRIKLSDEIMSIKGMTEDDRIRIEKTITMMQRKYDIRIGGISVESMGSKESGTYFISGPYMDGKNLKMALVINKDIDYTKINEVIKKRYEKNFFASKTLEDSIKHELAHIMTFQGCSTYEEYQALKSQIPFIPGISGYADKCREGVESLAEAYVRMQNGEKVPLRAKLLINKYIERWKK